MPKIIVKLIVKIIVEDVATCFFGTQCI